MNPETEPLYDLEASLAQQIAVLMSDDAEPAQADAAAPADAMTGDMTDDMADLFLEELNRLWADPAPLTLS